VTVEILDKAEDDLVHGFQFYETQQPGLGAYFLESLFADMVCRFTAAFIALFYRNYHRALAKRFPFAIFYTASHDTVFIHAVVDCRRKPAWITKHLK
jgi:hypothetical protein